MGKILTFSLLSIALFAIALSSCNSSGCTENQSSIPLAGLYNSSTGAKSSFTGIQVHGIDAPDDSLLYHGTGSINEMYLPLRPDFKSTSFCFHYTQEGLDDVELNDTITFNYSSMPYFASEQCGAMWRFNIGSVSTTTHLIDSVTIIDPEITNIDIERLKIYFKTAQ